MDPEPRFDMIDKETEAMWNEGYKNFMDSGGYSSMKAKKPRMELNLTTLEDVLQYENPKYLIEPVILKGIVNLFGGGAGKGKSLVTMSIIKSVLTGDPLWGRYPVNELGPVLLVDEETPRSFLKDRIKRVKFDKYLPFYFLHFQDVKLDNDRLFDLLMSKIDEVNPVFVVFDSLIRMHRQPENDPVQMSTVMAKFRKIANAGPTVWIIHHHKKGDGPLDEKARGSTDIVAGVDVEYGMVVKDGLLNFSSVKSRVEPFGPIRLKLEVTDDRIDVVYEGTDKENITQEIIELIADKGTLGVGDIQEALRGRGVEVGIGRLRDILKGTKELNSTRVGKGRKWIFSLNGISLLTTLNGFPPYKGGKKPTSVNVSLNGQFEKEEQGHQALAIDSQGLEDALWVEKQGVHKAIKRGPDALWAGEKNEDEAIKRGEDLMEEEDEGE